MAVGIDRSPPAKTGKRKAKTGKGSSNSDAIKTDQLGQYVYQHRRKRIKVIALFCDCGRSILVRPKEVKDAPIICSLCNTSFSWQQLSFTLD